MDLSLPPRDEEGNKGTFGTVAVAAGSITDRKVMIGGSAFAAKAALRSGAGMAAFIGSKELIINLLKIVPQAIGIVEPEDYPKEASKWQSIVAGPALGIGENNVELINNLLKLSLPTVLDADALNTIAKYPDLADSIHNQCVLTPHPKEFQRLAEALGTDDPAKMAAGLGCTIVLKGSDTVVVDAQQSWQEKSHNPALATGGTGDVLAGIIGGLMAQYCPKRLTVFECAKLGVEIHTRAGAEWRKRHGSAGLIIDELLEIIPEVMDRMGKA